MIALFLCLSLADYEATPWSPQSAFALGEKNGIRVGTALVVAQSGDRAAYRDFDGMSVGGIPSFAYHRGTSFGLEISAGARAHLAFVALAVSPVVLGMKQTFTRSERFALAVGASFSPWEFSLRGQSAVVQPELVASFAVSRRWSFDVALGANVRPYWASPLHEVGPRGRLGATWGNEKSIVFFGVEAGADFNFIGFARPAPFPYVLSERIHGGVVIGYARRR